MKARAGMSLMPYLQGGHFAALEVPKLLLQDLEDFVAAAWASSNHESR